MRVTAFQASEALTSLRIKNMPELPQRQAVTIVRATVHAGGRATTYQRAGTGASVLVLLDRDVPQLDHLATALVHRFRITTTDADAATNEYVAWLADFLDGLGLRDTAVVMSEARSEAVIAFATRCPGRIRRVVVIGPARRTPEPMDGRPIARTIPMDASLPELVRAASHAISECPRADND